MDPATLKAKLTKLGSRQVGILHALCEHGAYPGQWHYGGHRTTLRLIDSVAKHGLVTESQEPYAHQPNVTHSVWRVIPEVRNLYRCERRLLRNEWDAKQAKERAEREAKEAAFQAERAKVRYEDCSDLAEIQETVWRQIQRLEQLVAADNRPSVQIHGGQASRHLEAARVALARAGEGGKKEAEDA